MNPKVLEALQQGLLTWADDPRNEQFLLSGKLPQLEAALAQPTMAAQVNVAMARIGTFHLGKGQARVLRGDLAGWQQACIGAGFLRTALLIQHSHWQRLTVPTKVFTITPLQAAHAVCLGLALRDPSAGALHDRVRDRMPDGFWDSPPTDYPRFVRSLLALRAGRPAAATGGVYQTVLDTLTGPANALAPALAAALDHHLARTRGRGRGDLAEFEDIPMLAFPAEVLAALEVRAVLGAAPPEISHPWWQSPLCATRPTGPWPVDPLLQRCERFLAEL